MNISYEGIGQTVVTANLVGELAVGTPVQFSANGTVKAAEAGKAVEGVIVGSRGTLGAVAVKGVVTLAYSGTLHVGGSKIVADGSGGVKTGTAGCDVLVLSAENGMAAILL